MADKKRKATTRPDSHRGMTKGQIREERRKRSQARARRKRSLIMFGGILFAIVFIAALVLPSNFSSQNTGGGVHSGGHIKIDPDDGRGHILPDTPRTKDYSVIPATSGEHWASSTTPLGIPSPARWGRYEAVIPDEILVHNLEHGGIGFHYDCENECPEIVAELDDLIPQNPSQYIMSPYPGLPSKIAITAWRHHIYLDEVDVDEILKFIEEYQDRAPEQVYQNPY
jgi:hypothetical protein